MAADPKWLEEWVKEHGPYLYHATHDNDTVARVLSEGLIPWNENAVGTRYVGLQRPRPGHVYLGTEAVMRRLKAPFILHLRVDLRLLEPPRLNPDEDVMWHSPSRFLAFWERETGHVGLDGVNRESFGEWAERHDFGSNPRFTQLSLENWGSLAHLGRIEPSAIEHRAALGRIEPSAIEHRAALRSEHLDSPVFA